RSTVRSTSSAPCRTPSRQLTSPSTVPADHARPLRTPDKQTRFPGCGSSPSRRTPPQPTSPPTDPAAAWPSTSAEQPGPSTYLSRVVNAASEAFEELDEAWRVALTEAWQSWCSGSAGVGAAITDDNGRVLSVGRNRM